MPIAFGSAEQLAAAQVTTDESLLDVRRRSARLRRLSALALRISRVLEPAVWKVSGPLVPRGW